MTKPIDNEPEIRECCVYCGVSCDVGYVNNIPESYTTTFVCKYKNHKRIEDNHASSDEACMIEDWDRCYFNS